MFTLGEDGLSAPYPEEDRPKFFQINGLEVELHGRGLGRCASTAEARSQIGSALGTPFQCVEFISPSGCLITDRDTLTAGSQGNVTVVLECAHMLLGKWRLKTHSTDEYAGFDFELKFSGRTRCLCAWENTRQIWRTHEPVEVGDKDVEGVSFCPSGVVYITAFSEDAILIKYGIPQVGYMGYEQRWERIRTLRLSS